MQPSNGTESAHARAHMHAPTHLHGDARARAHMHMRTELGRDSQRMREKEATLQVHVSSRYEGQEQAKLSDGQKGQHPCDLCGHGWGGA